MIVRLLHQMSSTRNGKPWPSPGETIDLPESEAITLLSNRMAEAVKDAPKVETTAAKPKAEEAVKPAPRPRGRPRKKPAER